MYNILVARKSLPMSMSLTHNVATPQYAPMQAAPCAPARQYQEPIPKLMCEVVFESNELVVIRSVLTLEVYTIDKSRGITLEEPTDEAFVVYHHLHQLGITDEHLNMFHYDTLTRLYESDQLHLPGPE